MSEQRLERRMDNVGCAASIGAAGLSMAATIGLGLWLIYSGRVLVDQEHGSGFVTGLVFATLTVGVGAAAGTAAVIDILLLALLGKNSFTRRDGTFPNTSGAWQPTGNEQLPPYNPQEKL